MAKVGRKSYIEEHTRLKVIRLSFAKIFQALRDPRIPLKDKAHLALEVVKRQIPNVTEEIGNTASQTLIQVIKDYTPRDSTVLHPETNDSTGRVKP